MNKSTNEYVNNVYKRQKKIFSPSSKNIIK